MSIYLKPTLKTVTGHWKNNFSPVGLTCFSDKTWYYIYLLKYKDFTVGKTWLNIQKEYKSWGDCSSCSCPSSTLLSKHGSWHPTWGHRQRSANESEACWYKSLSTSRSLVPSLRGSHCPQMCVSITSLCKLFFSSHNDNHIARKVAPNHSLLLDRSFWNGIGIDLGLFIDHFFLNRTYRFLKMYFSGISNKKIHGWC